MAKKAKKVLEEVEVDSEDFEIPQEYVELLDHLPIMSFGGSEVWSFDEFKGFTERLAVAMKPNDEIDWQYYVDYVEVTNEIYELRATMKAVMEEARGSAVEALLRKKFVDESPPGSKLIAYQTAQALKEWRESSPDMRKKIEAGLARYGSSPEASIRAMAFDQRRVDLEYLEVLIASAQDRRGKLLREYYGRRELIRRAEEASDRLIEAKLKTLPAPKKPDVAE